MDKNRILLFFVLSLAVLYGSRFLLPPPPPPPPAEKQAPSSTQTKSPAPEPVPGAATPEPSGAGSPGLKLGEDIRGERPEEVVIDNPLYIATLSNVGGVLKSFRLKGYPDSAGKPVEMVDSRAATKLGWPLTVDSGDKARDEALAKATFRVQREGSKVSLEWAEKGIQARKVYQFDPDTYTFSIDSKVSQGGAAVPHKVAWVGFGDSEVSSAGFFCWIGVGSCDETSKQAVVDDLSAATSSTAETPVIKFKPVYPEAPTDKTAVRGPVLEENAKRAGMQDQFFLLMFNVKEPAKFDVSKNIVPAEGTGPPSFIGVAAPAQQGEIRVYTGPKSRVDLEKAEPGLGSVVDHGMFWFITEPLAKALMWIHGYVGNYGWAIILLTCAINFAMFPLRLKQQLSMQKMQKVAPQMKTLQDQLKKLKPGDPRRTEVQTKMMNVYKDNGVNPVGGCFPLLLQLPFLYAFFQVLSITIELRRAPWILWIHDLSQQDPYFILPLLMAVSMIAMQKMTPTTVDPQQARMMMIMPIMMVFLFLTSPSGLMLYWLTGNMIGIGQQVFINKYWSPASAIATTKKDKGRPEISV